MASETWKKHDRVEKVLEKAAKKDRKKRGKGKFDIS